MATFTSNIWSNITSHIEHVDTTEAKIIEYKFFII